MFFNKPFRKLYEENDVCFPVEKASATTKHIKSAERMTVNAGVYTQRLYRAGEPVSGSRMIHGRASSGTISGNNQSLDPMGCICVLPVPIMVSHAKLGEPVGEVTLLRRSDREVYIQGIIFDDEPGRYVWNMIQAGELRSLSVGPEPTAEVRAKVDGVIFFRRWRLRELSLCREGYNPDACLEIFRS